MGKVWFFLGDERKDVVFIGGCGTYFVKFILVDVLRIDIL